MTGVQTCALPISGMTGTANMIAVGRYRNLICEPNGWGIGPRHLDGISKGFKASLSAEALATCPPKPAAKGEGWNQSLGGISSNSHVS